VFDVALMLKGTAGLISAGHMKRDVKSLEGFHDIYGVMKHHT